MLGESGSSVPEVAVRRIVEDESRPSGSVVRAGASPLTPLLQPSQNGPVARWRMKGRALGFAGAIEKPRSKAGRTEPRSVQRSGQRLT